MRTRAPRQILLAVILTGCSPPELLLRFGDVELGAGDLEAGAFPGLVGVPNLDDDDEDGQIDFEQAPFDDDFTEIFVSAEAFRKKGREVVLELTGDVDDIAIWRAGRRVLGGSDTLYTLDKDDAEQPFQVVFGAPLARGVLTLRKDREDDEVRLALTGAPLILNHHLQPAERVYVGSYNDGFSSNAAMIADMQAVLGDRLTVFAGATYDYDVWVQDEPEFGTFTAPGQRLDLVIDSVRDGGLDDLPKDLRAPGTTSQTWGDRPYAQTYDSFGNLEVTPPVEVDGVAYPYGRIYYGANGSQGVVPELVSFLEAQRVQAPFVIDSTWLCVGHVDEFLAFLPDDTAPRGFRLLVADTAEGLAVLDAIDPNTSLPRFAPNWSYGIGTVGELRDDATRRQYNADIQANHIEPALDVFRTEIGLQESEIVRLPSLFRAERGCGALAMIPGSINLLVAGDADGRPQVFMADPFIRADVNDPGSDLFIQAIRERMPAGLDVHFVDDFKVYHLGWGEVHCATNTVRTPHADWWKRAVHLLGEEE